MTDVWQEVPLEMRGVPLHQWTRNPREFAMVEDPILTTTHVAFENEQARDLVARSLALTELVSAVRILSEIAGAAAAYRDAVEQPQDTHEARERREGAYLTLVALL